MTALYVPPTDEADHKKQNQSLQLIGGLTSTNTTNIATNTADIVTVNALRASSSTFGLAKVDNTSMTAASGVLSTGRAAKSDQTTATSTTLAVTPSVQQNHPSAAKAWVNFVGSTAAINASYNITSVVRNSAGDYTITFTTAFTGANAYAAVITTEFASISTDGGWSRIKSTTRAAGSVGVQSFDYAAAAFNLADPATMHVVFFGTQ